jgi:hypothetical protein
MGTLDAAKWISFPGHAALVLLKGSGAQLQHQPSSISSFLSSLLTGFIFGHHQALLKTMLLLQSTQW